MTPITTADVLTLLLLTALARVVWYTIGYSLHYLERWRLRRWSASMKGIARVLRHGPEPEQ